MKHTISTILLIYLALFSEKSMANWSLNIGYQNPGITEYGANFLYEWSSFGFEVGLGRFGSSLNIDNDEKDTDDDNLKVGLGGDLDFKVFFQKAPVRPYLQLGSFFGTSGSIGDNSGINLGLGSTFFGGGLFFGKTSFYGYVSYNIVNSFDFLQAGLGFDI